MTFRTLLTAMLIGLILFIIAVALGMKFEWAEKLWSDDSVNTIIHSSRVESESAQQNKPSPQEVVSDQYKLVGEQVLSDGTEREIKDQCIRSSRQAGVTNAHIHQAVAQCVSRTQQRVQQDNFNSLKESKASVVDPDTIEACNIVAAEEKELNNEQRKAMVKQCIEANTGN
ncbi:MAG: hypothetical protein KAH22_00340 [Thiotrichaceae bacterium]|nr:hypothetical protein [Thiotrichaceae bacterium]